MVHLAGKGNATGNVYFTQEAGSDQVSITGKVSSATVVMGGALFAGGVGGVREGVVRGPHFHHIAFSFVCAGCAASGLLSLHRLDRSPWRRDPASGDRHPTRLPPPLDPRITPPLAPAALAAPAGCGPLAPARARANPRSPASPPASTASTSTPSATSSPTGAPRPAGTTTPSTARTAHPPTSAATSATSATSRPARTAPPTSTLRTASSPSVAAARFLAAASSCTMARTTWVLAGTRTRTRRGMLATARRVGLCESPGATQTHPVAWLTPSASVNATAPLPTA